MRQWPGESGRRRRGLCPRGRAAHRNEPGCAGVVPSERTGLALTGTCAKVPAFNPAGRSLQSQYSRHHHVSVTKSDSAPSRMVAAVRRAVTAAGSDGPGQEMSSAAGDNRQRLAQFCPLKHVTLYQAQVSSIRWWFLISLAEP
jgi:hypothetical protein